MVGDKLAVQSVGIPVQRKRKAKFSSVNIQSIFKSIGCKTILASAKSRPFPKKAAAPSKATKP